MARAGPLPGRSTVRDFTGGIRTRFSIGAKYPKSSPPALVWPRDAANRITKQIHLRRVNGAPLLRTSKVRSVIGIRLIAFVPSDRPRALGHTPLRREPRDPGLPFRL